MSYLSIFQLFLVNDCNKRYIYTEKEPYSGEKMYRGKAEVIDERTLKLIKPLKSKEKEVIVIIKGKKLFREEIDAPKELIDELLNYEYDSVGD